MATNDWRLAKSLIVFRDQINQLYPNRSRASDGTIGDTAHAATVSDHNPLPNGVVTAFDLTHDPEHGVDCNVIAESLRNSRNPRIRYVIFNRRVFDPGNGFGWGWQPYNGDNPHDHHMHISVYNNYDDETPWPIVGEDMKPATYEEANIYAQELLFRDMPREEWNKFHKGKTRNQLFDDFRDAPEREEKIKSWLERPAEGELAQALRVIFKAGRQ